MDEGSAHAGGRDRARRYVAPLDPADPRFGRPRDRDGERRHRRLVANTGPGNSPMDPRVRALRILIPLTFLAVVAGIVLVFFLGLDPGTTTQVIGPEPRVRAAVADRPHRICYEDTGPCAWLSLVEGELYALSTNGPLREEFGRMGVSWCSTSGYFGSNVSGSRFDPRGNVVSGPAPRGLDRYRLAVDDHGALRIDFRSLTTGLQAGRADEFVPERGPQCDEIPFDREADLNLE
ncbi:MAG: hypothetical protein GEU81_13750 [Nitriliruptorales bacterium]|nr:hypothetical protein [Nitriliruptorales bacterium]